MNPVCPVHRRSMELEDTCDGEATWLCPEYPDCREVRRTGGRTLLDQHGPLRVGACAVARRDPLRDMREPIER